MTDAEANLLISEIVSEALDLARATGIPEAMIACGFAAALLNVAKSTLPEACRGVFYELGDLLAPEEGQA